MKSEKSGRADLDGGTTWGPKPMPVMVGTTPDPRGITPFYSPLPNPGQTHPNTTPMFKPQGQQQQQQQQPYPESSSGYYSQTALQSTYSSAPSGGYSPPPNQAQFAPLHLNAPPAAAAGTSAYTSSTDADLGPTPWATSILGETASDTSQKPAPDPSISKARYSGATSLGASSTSRPPAVDDSVPPPRYEG
jgi:hypothetical protein